MQSTCPNTNTFRILISTDNHVGFAEKDGLRGEDSFRTFEEILRMGCAHNVDFILLGGDIFHESRPSLRSMHEVMHLLRVYCHGNKPAEFEFLSEPEVVFSNTSLPRPNYLDGNLNVGMPIFTIHGNHDDPSGPGGLCAADLLHTSGLLNLFGKFISVERIDINPILLRKGSTRLALYGLGAVREERLHRLFLNNSVTFYRPNETPDEWFSICVVHQNRAHHGPTSFLPEHFLPNFLDVVVWGHEHECRLEPEWNSSQNFYVIQPGSSIATALSESEAQEKAVALLEIREKEFKVTRLPLKTVRPFLFRDLILQDELPKLDPNAFDINNQIEIICTRHIEEEIAAATRKSAQALASELNLRSAFDDNLPDPTRSRKLIPPAEPLIRLRVDLSGGFESFSVLRFGQKFVGRVANPKDLVMFNRNREKQMAAQITRAEKSGFIISGVGDELPLEGRKFGLNVAEVEELIRCYLSQMGPTKGRLQSEQSTHGLNLFTTQELEQGLRQYVNRGLGDAIQSVSDLILDKTLRHLRLRQVPEERILADVLSFCNSRSSNTAEKDNDDFDFTGDQASNRKKPRLSPLNENENFDEDAKTLVSEQLVHRKPSRVSTKTMDNKVKLVVNKTNMTDEDIAEEETNLIDMLEDYSDEETLSKSNEVGSDEKTKNKHNFPNPSETSDITVHSGRGRPRKTRTNEITKNKTTRHTKPTKNSIAFTRKRSKLF